MKEDDVADDVAVMLQATNCLALPGPKFLKLFTPSMASTLSASGPSTYMSVMWYDWLNRMHVSRQARCSSLQFENSLGTTG